MSRTKEEVRSDAEVSAEEDLSKDIKQLLVDVHHELLLEERPGSSAPLHTENLVHAQKRLASLTVKNAIENVKLQKEISKLTKQIRVYTIVLVVLTSIMAFPILWQGIKSIHLILHRFQM